MTAHRAKGLEFDHVAILNGGLDRPSRREDADAPRRLFYVAMTRARSTLASAGWIPAKVASAQWVPWIPQAFDNESFFP